MMTIQQTILDEIQALRSRIAENIHSSGKNASGRTIASMEAQVQQTPEGWKGILLGRPYFETLETGNRPWKDAASRNHVPKWFADILQEWIDAKGLTGQLNAYAVGYKIIKEGTRQFRDGARTDIFSEEIARTADSLSSRLSDYFQFVITQDLSIR